MYVLGLSAFYHDSSVALLKDGEIIAAVQEERFSRVKMDDSFPLKAVQYCLAEAGIELGDVDHVVFYEDTHLKFDRIMRSYTRYLPKALGPLRSALRLWFKEKLFIEELIGKHLGWRKEVSFVPHHISHAAAAFYPSPFSKAAVLVVDGVGEWACTSIGKADENGITLLKEISYPDSLGILYSGFTQYVGFEVNTGEYKMMGLAPYGQPLYTNIILDKIIDLKPDGSYQLELSYFDFHKGCSTINESFGQLFGASARQVGEPVRQLDMDVAASIQVVFQEIMLRLARTAHELTGLDNLVLGGGVALNCCANGHILREGPFKDIWVQPAAGDAGGALGAALHTYFQKSDQKRAPGMFSQGGSLFGPAYSDDQIEHVLRQFDMIYSRTDSEVKLLDQVVDALETDKVVGWFQGRMEFGPRALGSRTILGNAQSAKMQREINLKIKYRESFRPFAPAALEEDATEYFTSDRPFPYMLFVTYLQDDKRLAVEEGDITGLEKLKISRSVIPAVTHVDYSTRVQTVSEKTNAPFYRLIKAYKERTGCPVVINTSFNVRDEPIVCSPEDALRCFLACEMDMLAIGPFLLKREEQDWSKMGALNLNPNLLELS